MVAGGIVVGSSGIPSPTPASPPAGMGPPMGTALVVVVVVAADESTAGGSLEVALRCVYHQIPAPTLRRSTQHTHAAIAIIIV